MQVSNIRVYESAELGVELRSFKGGDGEIVFSAEDLAQSLGYGKANTLLRNLRQEQVKEVSRADLGLTPGRAIRYITESGFYRAVLRSNLPKAQEFQSWVEEEVLPAIRNEGGYVNAKATPEQVEQLQSQLTRMRMELTEAETEIKETRNAAHNNQVRTDREVKLQLEDMREKVDFWGNAYMRMREEAGRICRENGVPESRLPIV